MNRRIFLRLLVFIIVLKQILWMASIPMWQFPDEQAHFAQVQNVGEGSPIALANTNNTSREIDESERLLGTKRDGFGNNKFTYHPEFNIDYSENKIGIYEEQIKQFPQTFRHEFVTNEATAYPPAYYKLAAIFYNGVKGSDLIIRIFVTRFVNLSLFLGLVYITYLIAKLVFPQQQILQITLILLVSFHPMLSFLYGGINSDNLFILIFSFSIFVSIKVMIQGGKISDLILMVLTVIAGLWTKETGQLIPILYIYPFIHYLSKQSMRKKFVLFVFGVILLILGFREPLINLVNGKQFISEVPNLSTLVNSAEFSFIDHLRWTAKHTYREVLPWYWGVFRWLSLTYPRPVHRVINWTMLLATVGILIQVAKIFLKKQKKFSLTIMGFLLYTSGMYFLAITVFDYLFRLSHGFSIGVQGRYFFPTVVVHMTLLLIGVYSLINLIKLKHVLIKWLGVAMIVLHSYAFIFVLSSYFDISSSWFFLQASQYKPWFFKSPMLELLFAVSFVILSLFLVKFDHLSHEKS